MIDPIERQAAIDAVRRGCQEFRGIFAECEKNLNELSSAQPEIIRCKDCRWWDKVPTNSAFPDYRRCNAHAISRMSTRAKDFCSRAERKGE